MALGITTAIYRSGDPNDPGDSTPYVEATIPGTGSDIPCKYYGEPPPPLTWCEFTDVGGGEWFCEGPREYDIRRVLHDDFTTVPTTSTGTGTIGCDTPWNYNISTGCSMSQLTGSQLGVNLLLATAAINRFALLYKDDLAIAPAAADAFWFSARFTPAVSVSNAVMRVGMSNIAGTDWCIFLYQSAASANWLRATQKDSSQTNGITTLAAAVAYFDLDIVLVPGEFATFWVNGADEGTNTTNIPTSGDSITPFALCQTTDADSKALALDYIRLEAISGDVVNPTTHPALTA